MSYRVFLGLITTCMLLHLMSFSGPGKPGKFYSIPARSINPWAMIGDTSNKKVTEEAAFEISRFITYAEYKEYMAAVKRDSGELAYKNCLPDSRIGTAEVYTKYLSGNAYYRFPVIGISWENAMNYCRWRTISENTKDDIKFIYRLPTIVEWLNANDYLNSTGISNDFNKDYSDWTLNAKDEGWFTTETYKIGYLYFHKKDEPKVLTRKTVAGNSFLYRQSSFMYGNPPLDGYSYYATEGYRHISFRIIKDSVDNQSNSVDVSKKDSIVKSILKYWGIDSK